VVPGQHGKNGYGCAPPEHQNTHGGVPLSLPAAKSGWGRLDAGGRRLGRDGATSGAHAAPGRRRRHGDREPEVAAFVEEEGAAVIRQERDTGAGNMPQRYGAFGLGGRSDDDPTSFDLYRGDCRARRPRAGARPGGIVAPDRRRRGTNALLCVPPAVIRRASGLTVSAPPAAALRQGGELAHVRMPLLDIQTRGSGRVATTSMPIPCCLSSCAKRAGKRRCPHNEVPRRPCRARSVI
jgi:hypothetical protein